MHADAKIISCSGLVLLVAVGTTDASAIRAIDHFRGRAIVASRHDSVFLHNHSTHFLSSAVCSFSNRVCYSHEIVISIGPLGFLLHTTSLFCRCAPHVAVLDVWAL